MDQNGDFSQNLHQDCNKKTNKENPQKARNQLLDRQTNSSRASPIAKAHRGKKRIFKRRPSWSRSCQCANGRGKYLASSTPKDERSRVPLTRKSKGRGCSTRSMIQNSGIGTSAKTSAAQKEVQRKSGQNPISTAGDDDIAEDSEKDWIYWKVCSRNMVPIATSSQGKSHLRQI